MMLQQLVQTLVADSLKSTMPMPVKPLLNQEPLLLELTNLTFGLESVINRIMDHGYSIQLES